MVTSCDATKTNYTGSRSETEMYKCVRVCALREARNIEDGGSGGDHVLVRERAEDHQEAEEYPAGLEGPDLPAEGRLRLLRDRRHTENRDGCERWEDDLTSADAEVPDASVNAEHFTHLLLRKEESDAGHGRAEGAAPDTRDEETRSDLPCAFEGERANLRGENTLPPIEERF